MYERTSNKVSVNGARKHLFTKKNRPMKGLPPSQAALAEHINRAAYQGGGHCWAKPLVAQQDLVCPSNCGWQKGQNIWKPFQMLENVA